MNLGCGPCCFQFMGPDGPLLRSIPELTGNFRVSTEEFCMQRFTQFLAGAASLGALASPAAAQYYPQQQQYQQPYAQQYQQPYAQGYAYGQQGYNQNQNPIGTIIDSLLGNRYNVTDRQAVSRCASAAVTQAQSQYGAGYNGYGNNGYSNRGYQGQGYQGQGYNTGMALRVTSITDVQRRGNGLRVSGMLGTGAGYNNQAYGNQAYGQGYNRAYSQLSFRCNVDYSGAVSGVRIGRG
jgi:hypothetical protein